MRIFNSEEKSRGANRGEYDMGLLLLLNTGCYLLLLLLLLQLDVVYYQTGLVTFHFSSKK